MSSTRNAASTIYCKKNQKNSGVKKAPPCGSALFFHIL
jgi:hypothetical protein